MLDSDSTGGSSELVALAAAAVWLLVVVGVYVWYAWGLSRAFGKLGAAPVKAWIPVVNEAEILKLGGYPGWNVVFYFLPVVNLYWLYLRIVSTHRINAQFDKGAGVTVLAFIAPPIWATLLAFGRVQSPMPLAERIAPSMTSSHDAEPGTGTPPGADTDNADPTPTFPAIPAATAVPGNAAGGPTPPPPPAPKFPSAPYAVGPVAAPHEPAVEPDPDSVQRPAAPTGFPSPPASSADGPLPWPSAPVTAAPSDPALAVPIAPEAPAAPVALAALVAPVPAAPTASAGDASGASPVVVHNPWGPKGADAAPSIPTPPPAPAEITAPPISMPTGAELNFAAVSALAATARAPIDEDDEDEDGATIVVDRKPRIAWFLSVDGAGKLPLTAEHVLLGRKPSTTTLGTQALSVPDTTRTLSKLHARLDLADGKWSITDLNSTNGVLLVESDGSETIIEPGSTVAVKGRFILGKVGMSIGFEGDGA